MPFSFLYSSFGLSNEYNITYSEQRGSPEYVLYKVAKGLVSQVASIFMHSDLGSRGDCRFLSY